MEKSNWARRQKPDTAKADLKPSSWNFFWGGGRVPMVKWNPKVNDCFKFDQPFTGNLRIIFSSSIIVSVPFGIICEEIFSLSKA